MISANLYDIEAIENANEERVRQLYREDGVRSHRAPRGEGPRSSKPAMIDRAAVILRNAKAAMTPEELAQRMKHKNLASLTAALHQVTQYGKPKRLAGWVKRESTGKYIWVAE